MTTPERPPLAPANRAWRDPAVAALGLFTLFAGFGQFGAVAALGQVAKHFGHLTSGGTIADRAGLSGTELGIGLAVLRLASLGGLPLAGVADRFGRRRVILWTCGLGLGLTALAAASPTYWWFVAIFALGRPLLSATTAVAQVDAAEQTSSAGRAKAVALVTAGYGIGAGCTAVIFGLAQHRLGFRGIFALALLPILSLPYLRKMVTEPERFTRAARATEHPIPVLGAVASAYRRRLATVAAIALFLSIVTGPANSFVFLYAQNVLHYSGTATAAMVVVAAPIGLAGLVIGRYGADRLGRRPASALAMVAMALSAVVAYSGSRAGLVIGYELTIFCGSCFAPAAGTYVNELFPTGIRASVAGWNIAAGVLGATIGLLVFGSIADAGGRFAVGAIVTAVPASAACALFLLLPETRGHELEELWPDG